MAIMILAISANQKSVLLQLVVTTRQLFTTVPALKQSSCPHAIVYFFPLRNKWAP
jgi:hypothetical protein